MENGVVRRWPPQTQPLDPHNYETGKEKTMYKRPESSCAQIVTAIMLTVLVVIFVVFGIIMFVEGVKTKPTAMDMMARFVGISETVKKGNVLLESDELTSIMTQAQEIINSIPIELFGQMAHKAMLLMHSVSEDEIVSVKTTLLEFINVLKNINVEDIVSKVDDVVANLDVDKINNLMETTRLIEQRLQNLHEIKIQI